MNQYYVVSSNKVWFLCDYTIEVGYLNVISNLMDACSTMSNCF